jgi:phage-related protein
MLKWNNIDFASKGIIVERIPNITKGKKNITTYQVEGRDGFLAVDNGTYQPFVLTVPCHAAASANFDNIKTFLDGFGTLTFDGSREYTAIIDNSIDFEKVQQAPFRKFPVQFLVNPIAKAISATSATISSSPYSLNISSATARMWPTLTIKGNGDCNFTFNNATFYMSSMASSKTYTFDCENKVVIDNLSNNCASQMLYDFPFLNPGSNTIAFSGSVISFAISYKEAFL